MQGYSSSDDEAARSKGKRKLKARATATEEDIHQTGACRTADPGTDMTGWEKRTSASCSDHAWCGEQPPSACRTLRAKCDGLAKAPPYAASRVSGYRCFDEEKMLSRIMFEDEEAFRLHQTRAPVCTSAFLGLTAFSGAG